MIRSSTVAEPTVKGVAFRTVLGLARGKVGDADLKAVRAAGYSDANVIEIVALVAMYSLTNFFNNVFDPEKDFPPVTPAGAI